MEWKDKVSTMFSGRNDGKIWNDLYRNAAPVSFDEYIFQTRRDTTIHYILSHADKHSTIIDVGCGAAPVVKELLLKDYNCIGLDYSFDMLKFSKEVLKKSGIERQPVLQADCQALPFSDAQFDYIICLGVISYVEDYRPALRELSRLLKPGGKLIISYRNKYNPILLDPVVCIKTVVKKAIGRYEEDTSVGRFLAFKPVCEDISETGLIYERNIGIGIGPLRFNRKKILPDRWSIIVSQRVSRFINALRLDRQLGRWLADVSLWVYEKPANRKLGD